MPPASRNERGQFVKNDPENDDDQFQEAQSFAEELFPAEEPNQASAADAPTSADAASVASTPPPRLMEKIQMGHAGAPQTMPPTVQVPHGTALQHHGGPPAVVDHAQLLQTTARSDAGAPPSHPHPLAPGPLFAETPMTYGHAGGFLSAQQMGQRGGLQPNLPTPEFGFMPTTPHQGNLPDASHYPQTGIGPYSNAPMRAEHGASL